MTADRSHIAFHQDSTHWHVYVCMLQASTKWWTAPAREGDVALATSEKLKLIAYMSSLYLNAVDIVAGQLLQSF